MKNQLEAPTGLRNPFSGVGLLNQKQTSEFLGVSERALEKWRLEEKGPPFVKVGNKLVRYRLSDLQKWIDKNTVKPVEVLRT